MADDSIQVTIKDPALVGFVRERVRTGEYASEAEVIQSAIAGIRHDHAELEQWLQEIAAERCDSYHANPESGFTGDEVRQYLADLRAQRTPKAS